MHVLASNSFLKSPINTFLMLSGEKDYLITIYDSKDDAIPDAAVYIFESQYPWT